MCVCFWHVCVSLSTLCLRANFKKKFFLAWSDYFVRPTFYKSKRAERITAPRYTKVFVESERIGWNKVTTIFILNFQLCVPQQQCEHVSNLNEGLNEVLAYLSVYDSPRVYTNKGKCLPIRLFIFNFEWFFFVGKQCLNLILASNLVIKLFALKHLIIHTIIFDDLLVFFILWFYCSILLFFFRC